MHTEDVIFLKPTKEKVCTALEEVFCLLEGNVIPREIALKGCEELKLFEAPLIGFAAADDPLFELFHNPDIIGPPYLSPKEWLSEAKTVISFFCPLRKWCVMQTVEERRQQVHGFMDELKARVL